MAKYTYHKPSNETGIKLLCAVLLIIAVISFISLIKRSFRNAGNPFGNVNVNDPFGAVTEERNDSGTKGIEVPDSPAPKKDYSVENLQLQIEDAGLKVVFLDVGQGDATLIEVIGVGYVLVDGGYPEYDDAILSYLMYEEEIKKINVLVGTHAHADHVGSLSSIIRTFPVDKLLVPQEENENFFYTDMLNAASDEEVDIEVVRAGYSFKIGNALFTVLGPVSIPDNYDEIVDGEEVFDINNSSVVLKVEYGSISFLLQADAENLEEDEILETGVNLESTVLKIGHHGSFSSTGYLWLRQTNPLYAVISCGIGNEYDHPAESTLSKIRDANVKLFRTDLQGTVIMWTDGNTINYSVDHNADADTYAK